MEILVKRLAKRSNYTIGKMYVDGKYLCDTLEDRDRDLQQNMDEQTIREKKVYGQTAIPVGRYVVTLTYSNRFKRTLPLLHDVKGFEGIRIHSGNTPADTLGCILVGENKEMGKVVNSRVTFQKLMSLLTGQKNIRITIE